MDDPIHVVYKFFTGRHAFANDICQQLRED